MKYHTMSNDDTKETGCGVLDPLETSGSSPKKSKSSHQTNNELEARMARIESRLVQLMLHFGLDPHKKVYD